MASRNTVVSCQKLTSLQVRGFYSDKVIPLPVTFTREFIPANRDHIPSPETARSWSHLEHIADEIAPQQSCDVGLLIGYNCPQALVPREVVSGEENQPFAQKTDLGWSVGGYGSTGLDYEDDCFSQEDLRFLTTMESGIRLKDDGHYEMPLPFKRERPNLPDNKACAVHRLRCLERKLKRNKQYYEDYKAFMDKTITRGDAERISGTSIGKSPAWYIPHHGYHPQKPGKIRIAFDCYARFQETSLNDHLLTGPELTNTLVEVLCRFCRGPVPIMCDIECMFHQFHVKTEDQDYLRFLC